MNIKRSGFHPAAQWSHARIAKHVGVSASSVGRSLKGLASGEGGELL